MKKKKTLPTAAFKGSFTYRGEVRPFDTLSMGELLDKLKSRIHHELREGAPTETDEATVIRLQEFSTSLDRLREAYVKGGDSTAAKAKVRGDNTLQRVLEAESKLAPQGTRKRPTSKQIAQYLRGPKNEFKISAEHVRKLRKKKAGIS